LTLLVNFPNSGQCFAWFINLNNNENTNVLVLLGYTFMMNENISHSIFQLKRMFKLSWGKYFVYDW